MEKPNCGIAPDISVSSGSSVATREGEDVNSGIASPDGEVRWDNVVVPSGFAHTITIELSLMYLPKPLYKIN